MKNLMKKMFVIGLALYLTAMITGCGAKEVTLDTAAVADTVLEQVAFDAELEKASAITAQLMYVLPEGAEIELYMGNGSFADEFAVITCASSADVEAAKTAVEQHLSEVKSSFEAYIPEEAAKIDDAVVKTLGKYVILCVSDDANADSVIDTAVK